MVTYREARERAGMSLTDAAKSLGVSKAAVSIWENGKSDPLLENLRNMAALYGVPIGDLLSSEIEVKQ